MAEEFDPKEAERRLAFLAGRLSDRLRNPVQGDEARQIVNDLAGQIARQLGFEFVGRPERDRFYAIEAGNRLAVNPDNLFQWVVRTLAFVRETDLGGVPTLAPDSNNESDAPIYTLIDVFDRTAMTRVGQAARREVGPPPDPAAAGNRSLADWLRRALPEHPWARLSEESSVVQGLGMDLSMSFARTAHAAATRQPATVGYSVDTQNSGLVLDAFPEMIYMPRRFGSTKSTPVHGNLSKGWWKFEAVVLGALVRDTGRHSVSSTSTSTITRDF